MSEPIKKPIQTSPESYKPDAPILTDMLEKLSSEKVIDTFVVEGVEFTIIEKPKTFYAGAYGVEQDKNWDPSATSKWWWSPLDIGLSDEQKDSLKAVRDIIDVNCRIDLYIDYTTKERPCAALTGYETTSREQPEGVHVIEAEPSLYIRVNHTHELFALTKKLIGKYVHQYHLLDVHELIKHIFCEGGECVYEFNGCAQNGNEDMQVTYGNEELRYAAVPVKIKGGCEKVPVKLNIDYPFSAKSPFKSGIDFTKTLADIYAAQEPPKEFEKMKFGGQDWLVLDKQDGKALILSEIITCDRQYHKTDMDITWSKCDLRVFLNNGFYNSFDEQDKARIIKTRVTTPVQPWHGTDGGEDTDDYVFILSVQEVVKYFGDSGDLDSRFGWWASMEGMWLGNGFGQILVDQYNNSRMAKKENGNAAGYMTRTPGRLNKFVTGVTDDGRIGMTGVGVAGWNGVRPAMWINL